MSARIHKFVEFIDHKGIELQIDYIPNSSNFHNLINFYLSRQLPVNYVEVNNLEITKEPILDKLWRDSYGS